MKRIIYILAILVASQISISQIWEENIWSNRLKAHLNPSLDTLELRMPLNRMNDTLINVPVYAFRSSENHLGHIVDTLLKYNYFPYLSAIGVKENKDHKLSRMADVIIKYKILKDSDINKVTGIYLNKDLRIPMLIMSDSSVVSKMDMAKTEDYVAIKFVRCDNCVLQLDRDGYVLYAKCLPENKMSLRMSIESISITEDSLSVQRFILPMQLKRAND